MLLEMCVVQHAQTKSAFTFQSTKTIVSASVKSAKPALTCLIFSFGNKNRQESFLVETVKTVLQKRTIVTTMQKKTYLQF